MSVNFLSTSPVTEPEFKLKGAKVVHSVVAGSRVVEGQIDRKGKFRLIRKERVLQENLKLASLKKY